MGVCSGGCTVVILISKIKSKPDFKNNWKSVIVGIKIASATEVPNKHSFSSKSANIYRSV